MAHRIIATEYDRAAFIQLVQGLKLPATFEWQHGRNRVGSIKKGFAEAARRAGIQATPHMLRHTSAVWQAEAGIPIYQIAQFLGHSDSRITERVYGRFSPEFLKTGAEAVKW